MRSATLPEFDLRAGRLHAMTPVSGIRPEFSDVPPTFHQRLHVASTVAKGSWRAVAFELPGRVDVTAWSRAVAAFMARHDALRSELLIGRDAQITSRLQYDPELRVRVEVHDLTGPPQERRELLGALLADGCRPTAWPASWFGVVERGDSSTFIAAFDRSLVDDTSLWVALRDLHSAYLAQLRPRAVRAPLPHVGSHLDAAVERETSALDLDSIAVSYWHDCLGRFDDSLPRSGFPTGLYPDEQARSVVSEHPLLAPGQLSWLAASLGSGASAQEMLLAAAAVAQQRAGHASGLTTLLSVAGRHHPEWAEAMGWFAMEVPLEIEAAGTLRETLSRASLAMVLAESMSRLSPGAVLARAPRPVHWPHGDLNTVTWSDHRQMPGYDLAELTSATALAPEQGADDVQLEFVRDRTGVRVRCRRPDTPQAHQALERWLGELLSLLREDGDLAVPRQRSYGGIGIAGMSQPPR